MLVDIFGNNFHPWKVCIFLTLNCFGQSHYHGKIYGCCQLTHIKRIPYVPKKETHSKNGFKYYYCSNFGQCFLSIYIPEKIIPKEGSKWMVMFNPALMASKEG
jgi:hypothetical protein